MSNNDNKNNKLEMIVQPKNLNINLYDHQLYSIYKMEKLEKSKEVQIDYNIKVNSTFGINADPTGYGKTLSMVALILRNKMKWNLKEKYKKINYDIFSQGRFMVESFKEYSKIDCTVIVTNQSILRQWKMEFEHTDDLEVGTISTRKVALDIDPLLYDVIITTHTMYNTFASRFQNYAWKRFIFDEPGHIRIPNMVPIKAGFTWFITATPKLIYDLHKNTNGMMAEVLQGVGYLGTDVFRSFTVKNSLENVQKSFNMPETIHKYYDCYDALFNTIRGLIDDKISQMISGGNIEEAVKLLGGQKTDNVVELIKNKKEIEIATLKEFKELYKTLGKTELANKQQRKIDRLNGQLDELEKRFNEVLVGDCSICYDQIENPVMESNCQNIMCGKCILHWFEEHKSCPICRSSVKKEDIVYIKKKGDSNNRVCQPVCEEPGRITKFGCIENIINASPHKKVIIFSAYDRTFDTIRIFLQNKNISYGEIKGIATAREKTINAFKKGHIKVLFLNSMNNGSGINLQESTDIVLYHKMDNDTITQIIGRANRIGRKTKLTVHHLVSSDEI